MAWCRRRQGWFPPDMADRLESLGRFEMDSIGSGIDSSTIWSRCIAPFRERAQAEPDAFLAALRATTSADAGGYVTYGAYRLSLECLGPDVRTPDALALLDAAIAVKRAHGTFPVPR